MSAVPSLFDDSIFIDAESPVADVNNAIADLRKTMKCVDGVYAELFKKHKELEEHYSQYKLYANYINNKLNDCENPDNSDTKKQ